MRWNRYLALGLALGAGGAAIGTRRGHDPVPSRVRAAAAPRVRTLPLSFEPNRGQFSDGVRFVARGLGEPVVVRDGAVDFAAGDRALRMRIVGAAEAPTTRGERLLPGRSNYLLGNDPSRWVTEVPNYSRVRTEGVLPGVDLLCYGSDGRFEYDLEVAPGADPAAIALEFEGADELRIDAGGDLVAKVGDAEVRQLRPTVFQEIDGERRRVEGAYVLAGPDRVGFALGALDASRPLCIDPVVVYGSYHGGTYGTIPTSMERDAAGNFYLTGYDIGAGLPVVNAYDSTFAGPYCGSGCTGDGWVVKIDPTGSTRLFSTYVGGVSDDVVSAVGVDAGGSVLVGGYSRSSDFPTTAGSIQPALVGSYDMFLLKLSSSGSTLSWSTFLGTEEGDYLADLLVETSGSILVCGTAGWGTVMLPHSASAIKTTNAWLTDGWVGRIASDGASVLGGTNVGSVGINSSGNDGFTKIAVDGSGNYHLVGYTNTQAFPTVNAAQGTYGGNASDWDAVIVGVSADFSSLIYSSFLGGSGVDWCYQIAPDGAGGFFACGSTQSTNFPIAGAAQKPTFGSGDTKAFLVRYTASGAITLSSFLGGSGRDEAYGLTVDASGRPWVTGATWSTDFPIVNGPRDTYYGGFFDAFLVRYDATGTAIEYSTYIGGGAQDYGLDVRLDANGNPFVGGFTGSTDLPTTAGAFQPSSNAPGAAQAFLATPPEDPDTPVLTDPTVDAFFLPKKVVAKEDEDPAKSRLTVVGYFDTGSEPLDAGAAATLSIGDMDIEIPEGGLAPGKKGFVYEADGLVFSVLPHPSGSSRAKFKLVRTGDFAGAVLPDGALSLRFSNGAIEDGQGEVVLSSGQFQLGKTRGALVAPNLFVMKAKAGLKGGGKDSLSLVVGLATDGTTPAQAPAVHLSFGTFEADVPAEDFVPSGDRFVFQGDAGGVKGVVLDYAKETVTFTVKDADLGAFEEGPGSVEIAVTVGEEERSVRVRAVRSGTKLVY